MRYKAYLNDTLFFDTGSDAEDLHLISAELKLEYGGAGSFAFELPPTNTAYGNFNWLKDFVSVERDGEELFYGRVYSINEYYDTTMKIECEGILAAFNDTLPAPFTHEGNLLALVTAFVELHNAASDIQFSVGNIEPEDDYTYRAYENYETTWTRLSALVDSYGGYLCARREDDTIYLDWYEDEKEDCGQDIVLGENMLDITQESEASDIFTALIPFGADETDEDTEETTTVDITSVNDGVNYIYDSAAVKKFGWIWATYTWDDVTEPSNLLSNAKEYLSSNCKSKVTITVSAVDLANAGLSIYHFALGSKIYVESSAHNIFDSYLCSEIDYNLLDPSQDTLTLGEEVTGYVTASNATSKKADSAELMLLTTDAQITVLTAQISALSTKLTAALASISDLEETAEELADALEELSGRVTALEGTEETEEE